MPPSNSFIPLPFGLRDLQIFALSGLNNETYGVGVDMPNNQKLTFSEAEQFVEMRGDDALQAVHGKGPQVDWDLTAGGISLDAYKIMAGGTIVETGVWANGTGTGVRVYHKTGITQRPYFRVEGQAYSDSGGDFHCLIYRAKVNQNLTGTFDENAFWLTGAKGIGLPRISDSALYDFIQNEQATDIGTGVPTVTAVSPTGGAAAGGTACTLTGSNFTGATAVNFGATAATALVVVSSTQITCTAPAHAAGQVDVTVVTPSGTSSPRPGDHFTYV